MFPTVVAVCALAQVRPGPHAPKPTKEVLHTVKTHPFQPPHFATRGAKSLTYAMLRAEGHLGPTRIRISGEGGNATIDWYNGELRQSGSGGTWVYRRGILTVSCRKGFFRGKANRSDLLDYVTALTGGLDTFARELLFHQRPFEDFMSADQTARIAGHIRIGGSDAQVLQLDGKSLRATLMVRRRDHLVLSADADTLSPSGALLYRAHRSYGYAPVSDTGVFYLRPPRGTKVRKLPKNAIKIGHHFVH